MHGIPFGLLQKSTNIGESVFDFITNYNWSFTFPSIDKYADGLDITIEKEMYRNKFFSSTELLFGGSRTVYKKFVRT